MDRLARVLFVISAAMLVFGSGVVAEHYNVFPLPWLKSSALALEKVLNTTGVELPWYYTRADTHSVVPVLVPERMAPGLTLVGGAAPHNEYAVKVVNERGQVIHQWTLDWFAIWPGATHIPSDAIPKSRPVLGHGVMLMPNGDLVFNFEFLALVRVDICGTVVWKLPYRTHHSLVVDNQGNFWVPGMYVRNERMVDLPVYDPPIYDYTLMQVSPDGKVLQEVRVFDIFRKNGYTGLLHLSNINSRETAVRGDVLHLNDVEVFPDSLTPGRFAPGDILISLRNTNAIFVVDPVDWRIKFASLGQVLRQHDPDFDDGNTVSVFDNNNLQGPLDYGSGAHEERRPSALMQSSRIVTISAVTGETRVRFAGTQDRPFFTDIQGQHERLSNGNMLLAEAVPGRVLEVDQRGETVWEYQNIVRDGVRGLVSDVQRLPAAFDEPFFREKAARCATPAR